MFSSQESRIHKPVSNAEIKATNRDIKSNDELKVTTMPQPNQSEIEYVPFILFATCINSANNIQNMPQNRSGQCRLLNYI